MKQQENVGDLNLLFCNRCIPKKLVTVERGEYIENMIEHFTERLLMEFLKG